MTHTATPEAHRRAARRYQRRQARRARCRHCGGAPALGARTCWLRLITKRLEQRERAGSRAWRPRGRGRPPIRTPEGQQR